MNNFTLEKWLSFSSDGFWGASQTLVNIMIILIVGLTALKILQRAVVSLESKKLISSPFVVFFNSVLRWFLLVALILLVLQQIGVPLNSLWSVISAIIAMIAIGFVAVWSILSNLLCTLMLLVFQPFRIGDEIEIIDPAMTSGMSGRVKNINLMFTILERKGEGGGISLVQIPNNLFFQKIILTNVGKQTFGLDKQLFEEKSLLSSQSTQKTDR